MFGLRASPQRAEGPAPVQSGRQKVLRLSVAVLIAPLLALTSAGCAQKQSAPVAMVKPHHLSAHERGHSERRYAEVELEDDGLEAQQPPLVSRKPVADDPNEPFSPNYGRVSAWQDNVPAQTSAHGTVQHVTPIQAKGQAVFQQSMLR